MRFYRFIVRDRSRDSRNYPTVKTVKTSIVLISRELIIVMLLISKKGTDIIRGVY